MNDDLRTLIFSASLGLLTAAGLIYATGYQGSVAGWKIGPAKPWLMMAGR